MLDPAHPIAELLRHDRRYHFDAYVFVFESLRFAQEKMGSARSRFFDADDLMISPNGTPPGQQLCEAMRRYAHQQYGYLAKQVLNHWGIRRTGDFGEIVFNLIEIGRMAKRPTTDAKTSTTSSTSTKVPAQLPDLGGRRLRGTAVVSRWKTDKRAANSRHRRSPAWPSGATSSLASLVAGRVATFLGGDGGDRLISTGGSE